MKDFHGSTVDKREGCDTSAELWGDQNGVLYERSDEYNFQSAEKSIYVSYLFKSLQT